IGRIQSRSPGGDLDGDPGRGRHVARIRARQVLGPPRLGGPPLRGPSDFGSRQVPVHLEPVGRKAAVETPELAVHVGQERARARPKPHEVEARIQDEERVVGPRDETDSALEAPGPLEELQPDGNAAPAELRPDRQQMRMMAGLPKVGPRQSMDEAHELASREGAGGEAADVTHDLEVERGRQLAILEAPDAPRHLLRRDEVGERAQLADDETSHGASASTSAASKAALRGRSESDTNSSRAWAWPP